MTANERAIVEDVQHVVDGGRDASLRKVLYALYVAALLLVIYGVMLANAFFSTQDPQWLRSQIVSWRAVAVLAAGTVVGMVAAWRSGHLRGPVLPPLPWIDLVVPGALDRALTLRRWWVMALALAVTGAAMTGAVVGGGAWFAGVGDPSWLIAGALLAALLGLILLLVWLAGQVSVSAAGMVPPVWHPRRALRLLRLDDLRTQASRATRMGGAVLLGDLRALRLETAVPVTRARGRRLRPGRTWTVIPRRDLLGLIRSPGAGVVAALVSALGAAGVTWSLIEAAVPALVPVVAGLLLHLGFAGAAEGLRLQGDNAGTPTLLGLSQRAEALGHLAVPLLVSGGSALVTAAVVGWASGVSGAYLLAVVGWSVLMVLVVTGTTTASAFRGGAPVTAFVPEAGPQAMLLWMSRQVIVAAAAIGGLTASAARLGLDTALLTAGLVALTCIIWGFRRVAALSLEHRE